MTTEELKPSNNEIIERSLVEDAKTDSMAISSPSHGDRRPVLTKQSSQKVQLPVLADHPRRILPLQTPPELSASTGSVGSGLSELASRLKSRS
ncbi:unnamed protein product [Musa acuminata subsp. burmannicoides]